MTIYFAYNEPMSEVARKADTVLLVMDSYTASNRAHFYSSLGITTEIYPLDMRDSPTIFSLLGILAWINEEGRGKSIVVEGLGQQSLLEEAFKIVYMGYDISEINTNKLVSPLHFRSIIHLYELRKAGIVLEDEARRYIDAAFSGGDAHKSSIIELSLDLIIQLENRGAPIGNLCSLDIFRAVTKNREPLERCKLYFEAAKLLDEYNTGAVKTVALSPAGGNKVDALVGCKLMFSDEECWPEALSAQNVIRMLLDRKALLLNDIRMVFPEEAACLAYDKKGMVCTFDREV
ncbi:hypothetical protein PYJP_10620 [Pyrofollis japonicus]|uniref:hypothetical protein n=1 Tax=Pyrofollis japonicus TaxID=3060460 RepID=UPI00295BACB6|nr:hypothetical protein [Pyrofollis japonicus]BEP17710.1 hypothetical protein PYJP_10620 [Pyrofollis japonicus]